MTGFDRRIQWGAAILGVLLAGSAAAQENLDSGKTPAQLYASDCAICHKTPNGLSKGFGPLGLQPFLREHYTASREAAGAIAAYVESMDRGAPPAERPKRTAKPKEAGKPGEAKSGKPKNEAKGEAKGDTKGSEPAAAAGKPAEVKPAEAKPAEPAPAQAKAETAKSADKPSADAKPDSAKSDSKKPDGEKKSD